MVQSSLCLAVYCEGSQLARDQTDEGSDKLCCDGLRPDWWWQWSHDCRDQKIECERNSLLVEWWIQITSHRQTVLRQWNSSKMETNSWSSSCSWFSILSLFKPASLPSASKFLEISPFYLAIPLAFHSLPFPFLLKLWWLWWQREFLSWCQQQRRQQRWGYASGVASGDVVDG